MLKKNRRILSAFLAILFIALYSLSVPAFAAEPVFDIQDYTIIDLQEMSISEKKELLANYISTYNPYGIQELMEEAERNTNGAETEISPLWSSDSDRIEAGQQLATHQLITLEALSVFISDFGFYQTDATTALVVALNLAAASGLSDLDEHDIRSY